MTHTTISAWLTISCCCNLSLLGSIGSIRSVERKLNIQQDGKKQQEHFAREEEPHTTKLFCVKITSLMYNYYFPNTTLRIQLLCYV